MPTIGIIDDDVKSRDSDVLSLNTHLSDKGWTAIGEHPLPNLKDYPSWIGENGISVLLIDQKLSGKATATSGHVDYEGADVVELLRQGNKTLPIYFLTNHKGDASVIQQFANVEEIIAKSDFKKNRLGWIDRFTRKGKEYFDSVKDQLTQLNDLSLKIAKGNATEKDKENAKAIQTKLELPLMTEPCGDRSEWLERYEGKVEEFDNLRREIENYLKQKNRKKKR